MTRPIQEQVVVITGASSGIGRETAIQFGQRGATVVLAARNQTALEEAAREVERAGGRAHAEVTDVAEWSQVQHLAEETVERYGRIDTWVNCAAVSEYATVLDMTVEEIQRIIQVILMGQIHGMKAALEPMRRQGQGTIINVASALAKRAVPLQAAYVAAKHGIKGFTEALRLELKHAGLPINVTLIMPSSVNTPLFTHARSKLGVKPMPIPPIYEPRVVAEAIVFAAEHPRRSVVVGGGGKIMGVVERVSPALADWYMLRGGRMFKQQKTNQPDDGQDNLFAPMDPATYSVTGDFGQQSKAVSVYTRQMALHPNRQRALTGAALVGVLLLALQGVRRLRRA